MEKFENEINQEITPKDISHEFETMDSLEFRAFLRSIRNIPSLSITTDFKSVNTPRSLKAFIDECEGPAKSKGQKRFATVRATREQFEQDVNAFESGVKWEKVK